MFKMPFIYARRLPYAYRFPNYNKYQEENE
jgi:hypothetical protein